MSEKIKVSVILPVYNVERYLRKCLGDILGQTLKELEVICIDDGSTDQSREILSEYEKEDNRVTVIRQENAGAAVARNRGMELAKGEYLSFLDADDFYEPQMLERAYGAARQQQTDIVIFRGDRYDDTLETYIQMDYSIKKHQLPKNNPFSYKDMPDRIFTFGVGWAWDKLYRRDFVMEEKLCFQQLRTSNDLYFVFSSLVKAKSIYTIEELLVHHRIHVKGSLSVTREKSWNCFYEASSALQEELRRMGIYEEVEKGFTDWVLHFCFWNLDTIEGGNAYEKVYNLICGECCSRFGFLSHERGYYAQPKLYDRIQKMQKHSCVESLLLQVKEQQEREQKAREKIEILERELREVRESTTFRAGRVVTALPKKMKALAKGGRHA